MNPKFWIIENPMGLLRKMSYMQKIKRVLVTYCQYQEEHIPIHKRRMKPTDLFGRLPEGFIPKSCKNGSSCHVRAPRGSRTGTQGLNKIDNAIIPRLLCEDIILNIEKELIK